MLSPVLALVLAGEVGLLGNHRSTCFHTTSRKDKAGPEDRVDDDEMRLSPRWLYARYLHTSRPPRPIPIQYIHVSVCTCMGVAVPTWQPGYRDACLSN